MAYSLKGTKEEALQQIENSREDDRIIRVDVPHRFVLDHSEVLDALMSLVVDTFERRKWLSILFNYRFPLDDADAESKIQQFLQTKDEWKTSLLDRLGFEPEDVSDSPYRIERDNEIRGHSWISFQHDVVILGQGITTEQAMEKFQKASKNPRIVTVAVCHQDVGFNQEIMVGLKDLIVETFPERKWREVSFGFSYSWQNCDRTPTVFWQRRGSTAPFDPSAKLEEDWQQKKRELKIQKEGWKTYSKTSDKYRQAVDRWKQSVKESLGLADNEISTLGTSCKSSYSTTDIGGRITCAFVHNRAVNGGVNQ